MLKIKKEHGFQKYNFKLRDKKSSLHFLINDVTVVGSYYYDIIVVVVALP